MSLAKRIFLAIALALSCFATATAQQPRGARTIIRGGTRQEIRSDSASMAADSLRSGVMGLDSASLAALGLDEALIDTLSADSIAARLSSLPVDSLASLMGLSCRTRRRQDRLVLAVLPLDAGLHGLGDSRPLGS